MMSAVSAVIGRTAGDLLYSSQKSMKVPCFWGLGFRVESLGFRVWGVGFRGFGLRVEDSGFGM